MSNPTISKRLSDVVAGCFYDGLLDTEDIGAFEAFVAGKTRLLVASAMRACPERFDSALRRRPPRDWSARERTGRTLVTLLGEVSFERTVFFDEHGRWRILLDELLGIPPRSAKASRYPCRGGASRARAGADSQNKPDFRRGGKRLHGAFSRPLARARRLAPAPAFAGVISSARQRGRVLLRPDVASRARRRAPLFPIDLTRTHLWHGLALTVPACYKFLGGTQCYFQAAGGVPRHSCYWREFGRAQHLRGRIG